MQSVHLPTVHTQPTRHRRTDLLGTGRKAESRPLTFSTQAKKKSKPKSVYN